MYSCHYLIQSITTFLPKSFLLKPMCNPWFDPFLYYKRQLERRFLKKKD